LQKYQIDVLVDVRSQPYSKYASQFDADTLQGAMAQAGIKYVFLGKELGGRPPAKEFYDDDGYVLYARLAESPLFLQGIERLEKGVEAYRVAMMCSEEDPARCHRHLLIARVLTPRGIDVEHIRGDGSIEKEKELQDKQHCKDGLQLALFEEPEEVTWRSLKPVWSKKPQPDPGQ
jgi:uncharacterized protein (DUF488 family)